MGARNGLVFNIGPHVKTDASRAATYSKRKKGLLKKVKELSILCGVDVAVMCHHPQMAGAAPLLWGQPNLDSVLSRYKGVAPEERDKRKLDNTSFLHNQVQKLAAELQHLVDHNRKLADHLENSVWDDRLNLYSAADLHEVAGQVARKKKEVAELLAAAREGERAHDQVMQPPDHYNQLAVDMPVSSMRAVSSPIMLHNELHVVVPRGHDLLMQQLMSRMGSGFRSPDSAAVAALMQQQPPNVVSIGATVPMPALCMTPPGPSTTYAEPADSENSIVSGRNADPDTPPSPSTSLVNLSEHHVMFAAASSKPGGLGGTVDGLEGEFGPIMDMEAHVDMAPAWYASNGMPTASTASDASDTNSHVKVPAFASDIFDMWTDGMGFVAPSSGFLRQSHPSHNLQGEDAGLLVPHVN